MGEGSDVYEGAREGRTSGSGAKEEDTEEEDIESKSVNGECFTSRNALYDIQLFSNSKVVVVVKNTPYP